MIENQLLTAFPVQTRNELCAALGSAYRQAYEASREFGSFSERALGYTQHFYCDAMLEQTAKRLKLSHSVEPNKAKNAPHLVIRSANWQMTPHRLSTGRNLPANALYRAHYSKTNDLFDSSDDPVILHANIRGYVYLLHSGHRFLELSTLTVPDQSGKFAIYNESLDTNSAVGLETEEISDQLSEGIKIKVEDQVRRSG